MRTIAELLADQPLFRGLRADWLELLAGCGQLVRFEAEDRILTSEGNADRFFVLRRGRVAIEIDSPGQGPLIIETLGPGDLVGVSWMLAPYRWTFDARALEPTAAVALDATCLRVKCEDDPALGYELFKRFAGLVRNRLQAARLQLLDLYGDAAS